MVSNLSFGVSVCPGDGDAPPAGLLTALSWLLPTPNSIIVAAAGSALNLDGQPVDVYPAAVGDSAVISVAATEGLAEHWSGSSLDNVERAGCHEGPHPLQELHYPPGLDIDTVALGNWTTWCGTSFAAAVVSAELAMLFDEDFYRTDAKDCVIEPSSC